MPRVSANGIEIYYEQTGPAEGAPLLLISGLGAQITGWAPGFLATLADAGLRVTTYDNRDVGHSSWLDELGVGDLAAILAGERPAPYLVADMAADGAGLVRALGLGPVHVVGVSMGGMIAQQFAIDHPALTASLTSIMSTPAPNEVGRPTPEALASLLAPRSEVFEEFVVEEIESWRLTGGPGYALDEAWVRAQAELAWARARHPDGVTRQLAAVVSSPDRRPGLAGVRAPALVLHGEDDPLVSPSGGAATAAALPAAEHVTYPGMGHSIPEELWADVVGLIGELSRRA
jgi:pimeloyl-ACP methyl ester carboxylesterase